MNFNETNIIENALLDNLVGKPVTVQSAMLAEEVMENS